MSQEKTQAAVMAAAVSALAGIVDTSNIAWPNKKFEAPSSLWAAVHYMPTKPATITTGAEGEEELLGILQIDINIPTNRGEKTQRDALKLLEDFFTPGKTFSSGGQSVTFLTAARSNGRVSNSSFWMVPLSVSFRARYNRQPIT